MCASQIHTYYHLQCQQSPTSISIIENLQAEACNTAYWHLQVTEAYWKAMLYCHRTTTTNTSSSTVGVSK